VASGVELDPARIQLAERVLAARSLPNVRFLVPPDAKSLPSDVGTFDYVMFSAIYEHLLPAERRQVMPLVWSKLEPGGTPFINQPRLPGSGLQHSKLTNWVSGRRGEAGRET
jgi:hypothetical protein